MRTLEITKKTFFEMISDLIASGVTFTSIEKN